MAVDPITLGLAGVSAIGGLAGSSEASDAAKSAAALQSAATNRGLELQYQMFQQQQAGQAPFQQAGYSALPYLQYLATGQIPQQIQAPNALMQNTQFQNAMLPIAQEFLPSSPPDSLATKTIQSALDKAKAQRLEMAQQGVNAQGETIDMARVPGAGIYDSYNNAIANFNPNFFQESPSYKWQLEQGRRQIESDLARRGKLGSSVAVNALADYQGQLGASEWDKAYGRLLDLTNIGRGAATTSGSAALATGGALSNLYQQQGAAQAAGTLGAGQQRASMYSNLGALPLNIYATQQYTNAMNPMGGYSTQAYINPFVTQANPMGLTPGQGL